MIAKEIRLTSDWDNFKRELLTGRSIMVSAPKNFGKRFFFESLIKDKKLNEKFAIVLGNTLDNGKINFKKTWQNFAQQCEFFQDRIATNKAEFISQLIQIAPAKKVLFILRTSFQNRISSVQLLNTFQEISHSHPLKFVNNFTVFVIDDLSLHFYELKTNSDFSSWDYFESKKKIYPVTNNSVIANIISQKKIYQKDAKAISNILMRLSGGHHGLLYTAISYLFEENVSTNINELEQLCTEHLLSSATMESVKKIVQNKEHYIKEATDYKAQRFITNVSESVEELHTEGILLKKNALYSILCPGVIGEFIENIKDRNLSPKHALNKVTETSKGKKQNTKEVFISYAWQQKEKTVMRLYEELKKEPGLKAVIDKKDLPYHESITSFMERIGESSFVIVVISDKYIRSEYCMYELYELYRNSNFNIKKLQAKIFPIRTSPIRLNDPDTINEYINWWKENKRKWKNHVTKHIDLANSSDFDNYDKTKKILSNLTTLLHIIRDLNSLTIRKLSKNNFETIKAAIKNYGTVD